MSTTLPLPTEAASWRDILNQLADAYQGNTPAAAEVAAAEALVTAFKADYPTYAYRFTANKDTLSKQLKVVAILIDDATLPLATATAAAGLAYITGIDVSRLGASNPAAAYTAP